MKFKSVFLSGLFLITFSFTSIVFSSESLTGVWLSTKKSKGGMANILEFRKDGTVASYLSVMMDYRYKLQGSSLTITPIGEDKSAPEALLVNFAQNELTLQRQGEKDAETVILKRLANPDGAKSEGIVGEWIYDDPVIKGKTLYYIFTADGFMRYRVPMPEKTVTNFSVKDDMLEISRKDIKSTTSKWQINEGILTLSSEDGQEWRYQRLPPEEGHYKLVSPE